MAWTQEEMDSVYTKAREKAKTDPVFRKRLLADPNVAISELSGKTIPQGFKIKVVENDPDYHATFVIPDLVTDEMSDDDLEKVAGGVSAQGENNMCNGYHNPKNDPCGANACSIDTQL